MGNGNNALDTFVELENFRRAMVGKSTLSVQQNARQIYEILEFLLSPENLNSDDEQDIRERVRLEKFYREAKRHLEMQLNSSVS